MRVRVCGGGVVGGGWGGREGGFHKDSRLGNLRSTAWTLRSTVWTKDLGNEGGDAGVDSRSKPETSAGSLSCLHASVHSLWAPSRFGLPSHRYRGGIDVTIDKGGLYNMIISVFAHAASISVCVCCLLYTSPSPRDQLSSRMPSSA